MACPKVVIVGGGLGGLNVAKRLRREAVSLLLIDQTNHHLFQPLLYQVASAALSPAEIAMPIREVLRKQSNTTVMMGEVVAVESERREVVLRNGERIDWDYLILAVGARHSYFGNGGWERYAPGLKTIRDALTIREKVLISFEKAERLGGGQETEKYLNFVIIGGGPTGVEMAGAIAEIAHKTMFKNFRRIKPEKSNIYLIEATSQILSMYPPKLASKAKRYLERMGVVVITGKKVTEVTEEGVRVDTTFYPCNNVIWAAGNQAAPVLSTLHTPLDRQGRVIVEPDLSIPGHPEIFVIGDAASVLGKDGKPLPSVGPVAIQQGLYVADLIKKRSIPHKRSPFQYWDKGSMATIGRGKAVAMMGTWTYSGWIAWMMWCFVHIVYLIGFRNRLTVMIEWIFFYLTGERNSRLIYQAVDADLPQKSSSKEDAQ